MRLILDGIEYAGKHTLALQIERWWAEQTGQDIGVGPHGRAAGSEDEQPRFHKFHDHFNIPYIMHTTGHHDDEQVEAGQKHVLTLPPGLMEYFQRYNIMNKFSLGYAVNYIEYPDMFFIDWYYGEAVYAPLYYGYGGVGEYGDRRKLARTLDKSVLKVIPDTVLVLMKASPEAIRKRFHERKSPFPHRHGETPFRVEDNGAGAGPLRGGVRKLASDLPLRPGYNRRLGRGDPERARAEDKALHNDRRPRANAEPRSAVGRQQLLIDLGGAFSLERQRSRPPCLRVARQGPSAGR